MTEEDIVKIATAIAGVLTSAVAYLFVRSEKHTSKLLDQSDKIGQLSTKVEGIEGEKRGIIDMSERVLKRLDEYNSKNDKSRDG